MDSHIITRVGVTGQRPQHMRPAERTFAREQLARIVPKLRDDFGAELAACGMARGVDQWFGIEVLRANMGLVAFLPFAAEDQMSFWTEADQALYMSLVDAALDVQVVVDQLPPKGDPKRRGVLLGAYHRRNQAMVDWVAADDGVMVVVTNGRREGGTWDCLQRIIRGGLAYVLVDTRNERVTYQSKIEPAIEVDVDLAPVVPMDAEGAAA